MSGGGIAASRDTYIGDVNEVVHVTAERVRVSGAEGGGEYYLSEREGETASEAKPLRRSNAGLWARWTGIVTVMEKSDHGEWVAVLLHWA